MRNTPFSDVRIGIDASNLRAGGGITHLVELLRAADPEKHGVSRVIVWGGKATLDKICDRRWLERIHEPALDRMLPVRLLWQSVRLPKLAQEGCDVLFVPGGSCPGTFRPFVTMSRNLLPFETPEKRRYGISWMFLKQSLIRLGQSRSFREADGIIFLNKYAQSAVIQRTGPLVGKLATIPHGVSARFFKPPKLQRHLTDCTFDKPFRFLYISIIEVYKHQWNVVEAVAALRRKGVPVTLDLAGPAYPPALRRLKRVLRSVDPGGTFVRYLGPVPHHEIAECYRGADGFVFASSCENMPNILLEAMAGGLPIACSDRGPMPEVLGDGGVYFDPENPRDIARALRELIDSPELRTEKARASFERAKTYFWERCSRETFGFLAEIARG